MSGASDFDNEFEMALQEIHTAEELYRDLVQAHKVPDIPENAFTVTKFARDSGLKSKKAHEILSEMVEAGELERISDGRRFHYYFPVKSEK